MRFVVDPKDWDRVDFEPVKKALEGRMTYDEIETVLFQFYVQVLQLNIKQVGIKNEN
jgi:hypothetical protein